MPQRRRYRRRKAMPPPQPSYLDKASQALAVAYAVRKLVNVEYKQVRRTLNADPNTSGAVINLTNVAEGTGENERNGEKIRAKHINVQGTVTLNSSATASRYRLCIVRDNNGSTTMPAITDLFESVTEFQEGKPKSGDPQSNSRFTVLFDKMYYVDTSNRQKRINWSSSLDHHIFFTGAASTDEGKGHIYQFVASNESTNDPVCNVVSSVKYIDN